MQITAFNSMADDDFTVVKFDTFLAAVTCSRPPLQAAFIQC